jgi:hypothetical protein
MKLTEYTQKIKFVLYVTIFLHSIFLSKSYGMNNYSASAILDDFGVKIKITTYELDSISGDRGRVLSIVFTGSSFEWKVKLHNEMIPSSLSYNSTTYLLAVPGKSILIISERDCVSLDTKLKKIATCFVGSDSPAAASQKCIAMNSPDGAVRKLLETGVKVISIGRFYLASSEIGTDGSQGFIFKKSGIYPNEQIDMSTKLDDCN